MESVAAFGAALGLILLLEVGDKTQLATISLAARHPRRPVFAGAALGLVAVTGIASAAGGLLALALGPWLVAIQIGGGVLFLGIGLWTLRAREAHTDVVPDRRGAFATAFLLAVLAELGDKTQIAVLVLAAATAAPLSVFAGAALALTTIAGASVLIGAGLARILPEGRLRLLSAALFLVAGAAMILEAFLFP